MDEQDKREIEALFKQHTESLITRIEEKFKANVGILHEDVQHKLDLVVEGHQMLHDKIDRLDGGVDKLDGRLDRLESKLDAVAGDLAAHRKDTEAHGVAWRVKEDGDGIG
jgi:predicted nuclease with TOPRIM domain